MKKILVFSLLILIAVVAWCWGKWKWTAFYYSDRYDLWNESTWTISDELKSYEECLSWLNGVKKWNDDYDSECWYKCVKTQWFYWTLYNCEETKKWIWFNMGLEETKKKIENNTNKQNQIEPHIELQQNTSSNNTETKEKNEYVEQAEQIAKLYSRSNIDNMYIQYNMWYIWYSIDKVDEQRGILTREYTVILNGRIVYNCTEQVWQWIIDLPCTKEYHKLVNDYWMTFYRYWEN